MIQEIMKKLGYVKEAEINAFEYLKQSEQVALGIIRRAKEKGDDVFVDYVKKTNSQKIYAKNKKTKKTLLVGEVFL